LLRFSEYNGDNMSAAPLRVAIIGASGIGKNHAGWFQGHGCEACAFLGSSAESVARTQELLQQLIGFEGCGYSDLGELLRAESPDIVCVSTPPPLHYDQVMQSLAGGAHVLCEKPLVYDVSLPNAELIEQARTLVREASERNLLLGTQMQYGVAVDRVLELANVAPHEVRQFSMEMETKNLRHGRDYEKIWIDLSPHPLSVLQEMAPAVELDESSVDCRVGKFETTAQFQVQLPDEPNREPVAAGVTVRFNPDNPTPLRRFTINGRHVDYAGRKNAAGDFRTYLSADGKTLELPDFVDLLVGNFIAACQGKEELAVTGAHGAQNVAWQLKILEQGRRV
jgi:predicted dehydrogenase